MAELFRVGEEVRHVQSGWQGPVTAVSTDESEAGQGLLVTVRPMHPRPKGISEKAWRGWAPITVTADELESVDGH